jgi:hypothetical protein
LCPRRLLDPPKQGEVVVRRVVPRRERARSATTSQSVIVRHALKLYSSNFTELGACVMQALDFKAIAQV